MLEQGRETHGSAELIGALDQLDLTGNELGDKTYEDAAKAARARRASAEAGGPSGQLWQFEAAVLVSTPGLPRRN